MQTGNAVGGTYRYQSRRSAHASRKEERSEKCKGSFALSRINRVCAAYLSDVLLDAKETIHKSCAKIKNSIRTFFVKMLLEAQSPETQ